MSEEIKIIYLVYRGMRASKEYEPVHMWDKITLEQNNGEPLVSPRANRWAFSKNLEKGKAGIIISIEENPEKSGSVYTQTAKLHSLWKNEDDISSWQASHDAARMHLRSLKSMKEDIKRSFPKERLQPLKEAYRDEASWERRSLMLAEFIRFITG